MKPRTGKALLDSRKAAYMAVFDISGAKTPTVLKDLAVFCRANESTFHPDARMHSLLEGRREVWLRITSYLNLTNEQLAQLYGATEL